VIQFNGKITSSDLYIGQKAGDEIEATIASAKKSIKIISPYIAENNVQLLIDKQKQGVNVALLTSDDSRHFNNPHNSRILRDVIIQNRHENTKKKKIRKWVFLSFWIVIIVCIVTATIIIKTANVTEVVSSAYFLKTVITVLLVETTLISIWKKIRVFSYSYETPFPLSFVVDPVNYPHLKEGACKSSNLVD
jgi:hypothetical protein